MKRFSLLPIFLISLLFPLVAYATPTATIHKSWLEHNVICGGTKCIAIHGKVCVEGMKNKKVEIAAYMMQDKGVGHPDTNGKFRSSDGFVAVSNSIKAPYETTNWADFTLYLPNEELHAAPGKAIYYIRLYVNNGATHLAQGEYLPFVASSISDNTDEAESFDPNIKTWKEDESKKGFVLVTQMPDSSITRQQWYRCEECKGYLKCQRCSGTTKCRACNGRRGNASSDTHYLECVECSKTGKCQRCIKHPGKCRCAAGEYPGFVLEQDPDYTPQAGGEWWNDI